MQSNSIRENIIGLLNYYKYLMSKWLVIFLISISTALIGFFYSKSLETKYLSETTFVLENSENSSLSSYSGIASMIGIDLNNGGGVFQGENLLEFYRSRLMIEKTLLSKVSEDKNELLIDSYIKNIYNTKDDKKLEFLLNLNFKDGVPSREKDSVITFIVRDINKNLLEVTKPNKKLSIINVSVKSRNEEFSKKFNETLVDNVNNFYIEIKTKKSLRNIKILQSKADSVRAIMNGAIQTAAVTQDLTPNLNPIRGSEKVIPIQKSQFSSEINKAILSQLIQNLELSKMNLLKEAPLIQYIDQPVYPLRKEVPSTLKGFIIGGAFGFILIIILLISIYFFKNILSDKLS